MGKKEEGNRLLEVVSNHRLDIFSKFLLFFQGFVKPLQCRYTRAEQATGTGGTIRPMNGPMDGPMFLAGYQLCSHLQLVYQLLSAVVTTSKYNNRENQLYTCNLCQ